MASHTTDPSHSVTHRACPSGITRLATATADWSRGSAGVCCQALARAPWVVVPVVFLGLAPLLPVLAAAGTGLAGLDLATPSGLTLLAGATVAVAGIFRFRIRHSLPTDEPDGDDASDPAVSSLIEDPFTSVADAADRLESLEALFRDRGDRRAVFLTVYARVTREVAAKIEAGSFENPAWVAEYLVTFANLYREALLADEDGDLDDLPGAWWLYFRAARTRDALVLQQALLGINAHVNYDLALALQEAGIAGDRRSKYRDHRRINAILGRLVEDTPERLARTYAPGLPRLVDVGGPVGRRVWFLGLAAGREMAWKAAVARTASPWARLDAAIRWGMEAASTAIAYAVLVPQALSLLRATLRRVEGSTRTDVAA